MLTYYVQSPDKLDLHCYLSVDFL